MGRRGSSELRAQGRVAAPIAWSRVDDLTVRMEERNLSLQKKIKERNINLAREPGSPGT